MTEIGDLDALLADLQQASAELETQIKQSPRNNNDSKVKPKIESPAVKINTNNLNYETNTVIKRNFNQK